MRTLVLAALVLLTAPAIAAPSRASDALDSAAVFTIGSSLGFDTYSANGELLTLASTAPISPLLLPVADPGLRLGVVLPGRRAELASNLSMTLVGSSREAVPALGMSFEGNLCLGRSVETSPYVGAHVGFGSNGLWEGSTGSSELGAQVGVRHVVGGGHGAVRLELRGGIVRLADSPGFTRLGVRIGYDLWL